MKWGNWPIFSYVGGGHREVGYNFLAKLIESDTDQMVLCLLCTWKTFKRELYLFHFLLLLPLKGVLLWIYISFSFSGSVGESCRQKWKWIFSKIHLILWFFKKNFFVPFIFQMITFDWYGIHDVAATSGLLLLLVQKKILEIDFEWSLSIYNKARWRRMRLKISRKYERKIEFFFGVIVSQ